jgi:hypothetical protein
MKQQSAVEWLYNNLKSHFEHDGDLLEVVQFSFEQAKEMEKEQKAEDWQLGYDACEFHNDYDELQKEPMKNPYRNKK